jgi:hypothetical protein
MLKVFKEHLAVFTGLGVIVSAAFGGGVSWTLLNSRITELEREVKDLSTPQSARAKICEKLMDAWIEQTGSSFRNGQMEFGEKLQEYRCIELASDPSKPTALNVANDAH